MREAYDAVMRVLTEDHPALSASGGRLLSRVSALLRGWGHGCSRWFSRISPPRILERGMKALGLVLIALCGFAYLDMWVYQATAGFTLGLESLRSPSSSSPNVLAAEKPRIEYAKGQSMGWIDIPRLGVFALVAHGDDARTLRRAVGHLPGTAFPGEDGNVVLAGHRDTFFRALGEIRDSDVIHLVMPDGIYTYRVEEVKIVEPDHVEVLEPTPAPMLTLVTCYPFRYLGTAPYRYIIRAGEDGSAPR